MKKQQNNKIIIIILIVIIVILSALCTFFATRTNSSNSNEAGENQQEKNTVKSLLNSVKFNNFSLGKPEPMAYGNITTNTLSFETNFDLDCSNDKGISGVTLHGYCTDKNNKKYSIVGPVLDMAFYCNHNQDHNNKQVMYIDRIFDDNDNPHDIDFTNANNIKWEDIEISYCKVENAYIRLTDGTNISKKLDFSYEINY